MAEPLEIEDFSGGVTDYYLAADLNKMRSCDNLLLIRYLTGAKPFTRPGSRLFNDDAPQIPAGAQRISTAWLYKNLLFTQSAAKQYWFKSSTDTWETLNGPSGNNAYIGVTVNEVFTYGHWNFHTLVAHSARGKPQKIFLQASGEPKLIQAGLPKIDSSVITCTPTAGPATYLYKFVYSYTYTTKDDIIFKDFGPPSLSKVVSSATTPVSITTIPVLANGATDNWDTATIKVEIYRTTDAGTVFYKVGEVTNGTTTFNDNVSDVALQLNELLYTEGGVVASDPPPKCKLVHVFGDTAYYANIEDSTGQKIGYRALQSIPGDIDGVPETFFVDVEDEIVGLSSTKSNLLLLCRNSTYRVDGYYDEVGRGGMVAEKISDTAGCISAQSAVQTLDGVFWASQDGIYASDGFRITKLNGDYDRTWREFISTGGVEDETKQMRIQGKYDKLKNRIWWTIQHDSLTDVDKCYILDLNFGVRENATFTTVTGLESFSPTAIEFYNNGDMLRCDRRGYVMLHKDTYYSDLKIDTLVAPTDWVKQTIFYELESIAFNFGTSFIRKFVPSINVTCESTTNLSLQIVSNNDDNKKVAELAPIRYRGNVVWGDEDAYWDDDAIIWNQVGLVSEKRRMPAKGLRCDYKQVKFKNAFVAIVGSDLLGTATIDSITSTATLDDIAAFDWPSNAEDYYIAFEQDGYERDYLITDRTDDVLTYLDAAGYSNSVVGSRWIIRGYPKDEILNLVNYSIHYSLMGKTQGVYNKSDSGENA